MEESPSKPSVAELAGRFKGHILPSTKSNEEVPFRRRPPSSLKLPQHKVENEESSKSISPPHPLKVTTKNSALIQKLQANLALSPTTLLPSPKSPEAKLQPTPLSPHTPESPLTPLSPHSPSLRPPLQSNEEEDPVSFQRAPEGTTLPNFNKSRARLSFKRRPPTRQHRRSTGDETQSPLSPSPDLNGLTEQVFNTPHEDNQLSLPTQEEASVNTTTEDVQVNTPTKEEARDNTDCDTMEKELSPNNSEDTASGLEEQPGAAEQGQTQEDLEEQLCPAESEHTEARSSQMEAAQDTDVNCEQ